MEQIFPAALEDLLNEGKGPTVVDVREADEVAHGKIPSAVHIPLGLLEFRLHELDKNNHYVIVCRSGGRSARATQLLESYGYHVKNLNGGMAAWEGKTE